MLLGEMLINQCLIPIVDGEALTDSVIEPHRSGLVGLLSCLGLYGIILRIVQLEFRLLDSFE